MNSFIYTITSTDRVNDPQSFVDYYDIDFGGFGVAGNASRDYMCEVIQLTLSGSIEQTMGYVLFSAEGLHTGMYHSNRPSNQCLVACISTNEDVLSTSQGTTFTVSDCQTKKRVKFFFTDSRFIPLISGDATDTNVGDSDIHQMGVETDWILSLRLTPLDH